MTFDPAKILESKRALRRDLATRPIAEKLALLDALRERELAIRPAGQSAKERGMTEIRGRRAKIGES